MTEHPIEGLMVTAMSSIQDMIDVNTIVGEPVYAANDVTIIPVSKVSFGFAAGGSEFSGETINQYNKRDKDEQIDYRLPFGGGAGAGVNINPVGFIVINKDNVKLLPVNHASALDKLLDYVPDLIEKTSNMLNKCKKEKTKEKIEEDKEESMENNIEEQDVKENEEIIKKVTPEEKIVEKKEIKKYTLEKQPQNIDELEDE